MSNESPSPQSGAGWILNTMPQLEEQPLYDKFKAGGAFEGQFRKDFAHRTGLQDSGIISSENGVSCPQLLQTQLQILACPSNSNSERLRTDQEELGVNWPIAVTDYKGVLDDTFLGQTFGGVMSNDASPYPSGAYIEPPPAYDSGARMIATTTCAVAGFSFGNRISGR